VGIVVAPRGRLFLALGFTVKRGKITEVDVISDPARLHNSSWRPSFDQVPVLTHRTLVGSWFRNFAL
jgi:RNA polymerase sigma-70 factor (ECF subfamily)